MRRVHGQIAAVFVALVLGAAAIGHAQERVPAGQTTRSEVRVLKDRATIWRRNPSMVLAVVKSGTVLQAISREDRWIEVVVPAQEGGKGNTGFVLAAYVEHVEGTPDIPVRQHQRSESMWDSPGAGGPAAAPRPAYRAPAFGVRGFGTFSYAWFQANDSFDAVFGSPWQPFYGGGAQVVIHDKIFVQGSFEQFKKTGQRVFVSDGEVFPLGIEDHVTINPVTFSAGYRFRTSSTLVSYVGGGAGSYRLQETSDVADPSENVDERHTAYHALGGVEFGISKWVLAAFEVQYTTVPDGLGGTGVGEAFGESNLGGTALRFKLLIGR